MLFFWGLRCVAAQESDRYEQLVNIEQYKAPISRPCDQDCAREFLESEYKRFVAAKKITAKTGHSSFLVDAIVEFNLATEIGLKSYTIQNNKGCFERSRHSCCEKYRDLEFKALYGCPTCATTYFVENKFRCIMWRLTLTSAAKIKQV